MHLASHTKTNYENKSTELSSVLEQNFHFKLI